MKKLILLMLVVMVPFLTYSQKRTKKGQDTHTESSDKRSNFMIIKGVEVSMNNDGIINESSEQKGIISDQLIKRYIKPQSRFYFSYDVGSFRNDEAHKLTESSKEFRSMAQAVNASAEYGWEFMNATVVIDGSVKIHYYYMKR